MKDNKQARQIDLIELLNPIIRGWANYHRGTVAKKTFAAVDEKVWKVLWQWAKRRHPNQGKRWIKAKYFKTVGTRSGVFADQSEEGEWVELVLASDTRIRRHIKVKADATPFDPEWEEYFRDRRRARLEESRREKRERVTREKNRRTMNV